MSPASNPVIISPRLDSYATSTWANGRGGQLGVGMDVAVASEEASGAAGAEVVVAEEAPEEEVPVEVRAPEEIWEGTQEDPQETERLKIAPDPGQPTRQQVAEHRITHWPFRSWCKWCVMELIFSSSHALA